MKTYTGVAALLSWVRASLSFAALALTLAVASAAGSTAVLSVAPYIAPALAQKGSGQFGLTFDSLGNLVLVDYQKNVVVRTNRTFTYSSASPNGGFTDIVGVFGSTGAARREFRQPILRVHRCPT